MDCCEKLTPDFTGEPEVVDGSRFIGRRGALKRLAGSGRLVNTARRRACAPREKTRRPCG
jgi:hypothetical protein